MKKVLFTIDNHPDRMKLLEVMRDNGYETTIRVATEYMPHRYIVEVVIKDCEVEDG